MNRHALKLALPLGIAAVIAAACGGSSSPSSGSTAGTDKPSYKIGYQGPLSGGVAALGINQDNGVKLAIKQANASGDLPFTLEFVHADDQASPDLSPAAARKLIGDGVIAVVGPAFSGASNAAGKYWKDAGLLAVTPSATLPSLTDQGFTTWWRANADDNAQGPPDADYLVNVVKAKKIYLIDDTSDYGHGLAEAFKTQLDSNNGNLVGSDSAPETSQCIEGQTGSVSQYPSLATKVVNKDADAVFYAGYYCDFALLVKQLKLAGFEGTLMSGDGSRDEGLIKQAKQDAEGALLSCQCSDILSNPKGTQFIKDYKAEFGVPPGIYSGEAFDVTNAIISKMKEVGADVDRASLLAAWPDVDYQGITKQIKFVSESDHNLVVQAAYLYVVKDGTFKYLGNLQDLTS